MTESSAFDLTPRAAAHVLKTMERDGAGGQGLRVAIITGGCSGYEYSLSFSANPEPDDVVIEIDALRVFVEAASVDKLSGTVLDYVDGLYGGGLKFTNPQATHTCGCGTSFSTE
jgi:iron-sulfur cluster assembly accessory protein